MKLYSYDIASAYPYQASKLLDLRDCDFRHSDASSALIDGAYYGFLVGDFTVYPDHPLAFCSPFLADRGDGTLVNFTGTRTNYPCLLSEVRTLHKHGLGEFRIKDGWFISPTNGVRPRRPFESPMAELYSRRGTSELKSYILKRVMTGVIGKLLETRRDNEGNIIEYGDRYNPIYHAICTTNTRLQVFEFLVTNDIRAEELVHVGVDGVRMTRFLALPERAPMGGWRSSGSEMTIVLSPGAILTEGRNFKRTGVADLMAECMARPAASQLGVNPDDRIDLRKLFLNQTRVFDKIPGNAKSLLEGTYLSSPVEL